MHRFRGNIWDYDCRPQVMSTLGYPITVADKIPEITDARNIELGLGLQVSLNTLLHHPYIDYWHIFVFSALKICLVFHGYCLLGLGLQFSMQSSALLLLVCQDLVLLGFNELVWL